jgi:hypothetical protein
MLDLKVNSYYGGQHTIFLAANACSGDINPIAVPITNVIANPITNVTSWIILSFATAISIEIAIINVNQG